LGTPSGNHPNNSERMTDDHVCITDNLRTAHLGTIPEPTPVDMPLSFRNLVGQNLREGEYKAVY
jgi:hypothetical protein